MKDKLRDTIALLARTPATLDALLRDLPETWTLENEGKDTWSAFDVVRHLIHVERNDWIARATIVRDFGETHAIGPVDRAAHTQETQSRLLGPLLDEFARLRRENLDELHSWNLGEDDLAKRGRHLALGPITLSELLSTWAVHDLTHLHQISRVLAHQYREAVGPWSAYLGVLRCGGHSSLG
jgi:hypothetical protein